MFWGLGHQDTRSRTLSWGGWVDTVKQNSFYSQCRYKLKNGSFLIEFFLSFFKKINWEFILKIYERNNDKVTRWLQKYTSIHYDGFLYLCPN